MINTEAHEVFIRGANLTLDTEMHTTSELGAGVPAFLAKLWKMVEDPKTNNLISWSPVSTFLFTCLLAKVRAEYLSQDYA